MHKCNKTINIGMGCCHQVLAPVWDYYNKQEVDELIEGIIAGDIDLSRYVTDERLAEILEEYAKNGDLEALRQRLEEEVDKLSTEVEKRAQKEDIEALEERVDEVESKIDDVDGVTEEKVNEMIKDKADKSEIPSLEGYATEQWVNGKNYLTEHQHLKTVNGNSLIGYGNIIIEGGGESVDLSDYYTKGESDERYGQKSVVDGLQSQIDDIDGQLSTKADESAIEALQQEIDDISKSNDEVNQELGRIDSELDTVRDRVDSKADRSDLANYQPKGDYVTEGSLEDKLSDYVTEGSLEDKLSDYPTKDDINDLEERIEDLEIYDFEEFATKEWVEGQGYLTEHQDISNLATKDALEAIETQISVIEGNQAKDLAKITEIQGKLNGFPTIWNGTKEEYDKIVNKDDNTLYLVYE